MIVKLKNIEEDIQILIDYLHMVDNDFALPLSYKANLTDLARKTLSCGHAFFVKEDDNYVALATLYCNNIKTGKAFLPILSVRSKYRGRGYARILIEKIIEFSRLNAMKTLCVDSVNPKAIALYKSMGFKTINVEGKKEILEFPLFPIL